jgi:glycine hydroxymethyltransferase
MLFLILSFFTISGMNLPVSGNIGKFIYEFNKVEPKPNCLYGEHIRLGAKSHMADFAGYLMPLWFSSISKEHEAVRQECGLFDCSHMGIMEVSGDDATDFLNIIATNDISVLVPGKAQYSYISDAAGNILDDIIIYQLETQRYMVVINAANEPKIKAYIDALLKGEAVIDINVPDKKINLKPVIFDMRDVGSGKENFVDIAIQGPTALEVLCGLCSDVSVTEKIKQLKGFYFTRAVIAETDCIVSKTGYTGAKIGFEIFVHPDSVIQLWRQLLEAGNRSGPVLCGLGARDSLRIEAGLPLYGHELAGDFDIAPFEAGYGWAVKLEKDFFIGKDALVNTNKKSQMQVIRAEFSGGKGVRPIRQNDAILDEECKCVGYVLSCASTGDKQTALAYVPKDFVKENNTIGVYYLARNTAQVKKGKKEKVNIGDRLDTDISGYSVSRFKRF